MIALGKLEQFDPASNFLAWMGRIVRFTALNHGRKRQSVRLIDHETADRATSSAPEETSLRLAQAAVSSRGELTEDHGAFDDSVLAALQRLDPTARACLLLRVVMNRPYKDIARVLDIAEGTAMSHVHRARMTLRDSLLEPDKHRLHAQGDTHATR